MAIIIDPPSGWKYGFPKPIPDDVTDTIKWLVEQGYPQKLIDKFGEHFYCRYWEQSDDLYTENQDKPNKTNFKYL